jgi:hypothetical protein
MAALASNVDPRSARGVITTFIGSADTALLTLAGDATLPAVGQRQYDPVMANGIFHCFVDGPDVPGTLTVSGTVCELVAPTGSSNFTPWQAINPEHSSGNFQLFVDTYNGRKGLDIQITFPLRTGQATPEAIKYLNCVPTPDSGTVSTSPESSGQITYSLSFITFRKEHIPATLT